MSNHHTLSREQFAEASSLAEAGQIDLARTHLRSAAEHALSELAARHMIEISHEDVRRDPVTAADRLAEVGAAPADVAPVIRDLEDDRVFVAMDSRLAARLAASRLGESFGPVQALIDGAVDRPVRPGAPRSPLSGGPKGALNTRGAEAAVRGIARLAGAFTAADTPATGTPFSGGAKGALNTRGAEAATRAIARFARALQRPADAPRSTPFSGGPKGALNRRGAETAARAVTGRA
jgi:hypothetical protein